MTYLGRLSSKGVSFLGFMYNYERIGISQVEKYERAGKSVIYGFHSSRSKMLLKSSHSLSSARIHEGILQHCLTCFQGNRKGMPYS